MNKLSPIQAVEEHIAAAKQLCYDMGLSSTSEMVVRVATLISMEKMFTLSEAALELQKAALRMNVEVGNSTISMNTNLTGLVELQKDILTHQ